MGIQDVMKQQEIRRNKEKRTKKSRKKKPQTPTKTAAILWRVLLAIFDYKTGEFFRFWPFLCPPIEVTAIYIYISYKGHAVNRGHLPTPAHVVPPHPKRFPSQAVLSSKAMVLPKL